jgi:phosphatidylserine/phosphatidylglycerophosphate/cardiolipin synthase-like enzyme
MEPMTALTVPVTEMEPRERPASVVTWLVDNADAYRAMLAACRVAHRSILMTQLAFDADCVAYRPDDVAPSSEEPDAVRFADVLLEAVNVRGVEVRILLNASLLLDTAAPLRRHFLASGADRRRLRIRGVSRFPQLLHAKILVVDDEVAFLVGSPFANGYWDDSEHEPVDLRRPPRELGGRPLHDLSVQLTGAPVSQLRHAFVELWNAADDVEAGDDEVMALSPPPVDDGIVIACSAPHPKRSGHSPERREILPMLLAGIASAERLIYIEHQYLSSTAVIAALVEVLARRPALEVVVVLNQNPDVTAYRGWQNRRLAASGLFDHPRVGVFSLWTLAPGDEGRAWLINQVFVHSKVVLVDDRWAMVGSANLDGVSLETYGDDFSGWLGQRVFRGVRNFDVAAVLCRPSDGTPNDAVLELRTALWREHLDAPDLDSSACPSGGWLDHWRRQASANVDSLQVLADAAAAEAVIGRRILALPYSRMSTPQHQLGSVGVPFANERLHVCFDPTWIEVQFSPNWLRNIFA